ncbi:ABC transporter substrate-binding protein [Paenibacillus ginsengarvi]|uniref:ABC transporter substrate-binding protein n=1 Tax=Paenibacillus ginsengarvi TaxID=400777 RepID=UPI0013156371|nr:extracellular solute-binding protein [Paenibacillus ginsengarvi]
MKKNRYTPLLAAIALLVVAAGCGGKTPAAEPPQGASAGTEKQAPPPPPEPVKLTLYMQNAFPIQDLIVEAVRKKYPHITLEPLLRQKGQLPEDLVAAGTFPDLIYNSTPWYAEYINLNVLQDLSGLVKSSGFDVSKLDPLAMDAIRMWGDKGELYALPIYRNFAVMYYNKDLFDKFGVPYPKDGMTWKDAASLAGKLSRTDGGVVYKGLDASDSYSAMSQLTVPFVKPDGKANLQDEKFGIALDNLKTIYTIPGNSRGNNMTDFYKGTLAMSTFWNVLGNFEDYHKKGVALNWDMVTMPTYEQAPGRSYQVDSHNMSISSLSKHKEAAFQVIAYLTSKEVQMEISKNGYVSSLVDPEPQKAFGANLESLKGKNVAAIFKLQSAPMYKVNAYDSLVRAELAKALTEVLAGSKDINSALRDANDRADKQLEMQKKK